MTYLYIAGFFADERPKKTDEHLLSIKCPFIYNSRALV